MPCVFPQLGYNESINIGQDFAPAHTIKGDQLMTTDELRDNLLSARKNGYCDLTADQRAEMENYCKRYAAFMDACKTEREATTWAVAEAEKNGFKPFSANMDAKRQKQTR